MSSRTATALVFGTSFCVLVLEILAGRLLAPLVGVSLETFTGIIGTVLAGIALGNAVGGRIADAGDPGRLVGPALLLAGVLAWLAPIIIATVEPVPTADPAVIVFLSAISFFAPAAVLSAVPPMVAKLRLDDLGETGRVVGSLSAAGTVGALAGTFLTGFVLVAVAPTRTIIVVVGLVLVIAGAMLTGWRQLAANPAAILLVVGAGVGAVAVPVLCDAETDYSCVQLVADPGRPTGRSLVLNGLRNSYVDLDDPTYLEFRYMRLFADVVDGLPPGPVDSLHVGGAGLTFPRYVNADRPGSTATVLEIDDGLIDIAESDLGFEPAPDVVVALGDARLSVRDLDDDHYDLIVGDVFNGLTVPWHLTTREFVADLDRVLDPDGVVVANLIDGGDVDFARAELATYGERFEHVGLVVPPGGIEADRGRNLVMIASHRPLPSVEIDESDGRLLTDGETATLLVGADPLRDDYAPVDQLRLGP
jgi:spermidine synthase